MAKMASFALFGLLAVIGVAARARESVVCGEVLMWSGGVTPFSAFLRVSPPCNGTELRVATQKNLDVASVVFRVPSVPIIPFAASAYNVSGLTPDTQYYYGFPGTQFVAMFKTFQVGAHSFSFAFASCASTGSTASVFSEIAGMSPLFFLHTGDLFYGDIGKGGESAAQIEQQQLYYHNYRRVHGSGTQQQLYRSVPTVYMWDDHDFGYNNGNKGYVGRFAARDAYHKLSPYYPLAPGAPPPPANRPTDTAIYQAFTVGRVRFIITDLRSEADDILTFTPTRNQPHPSTLGAAQRRWFLAELSSAPSYALLVWASSKPWNGKTADTPSSDRWADYEQERRLIADHIASHNITNLVMLAGDAHMLAMDNGTYTDYSTNGGGGFPLFHAAPLDRSGSVKGGPFTTDCIAYRIGSNNQFGWMRVRDSGGDTVCFDWKAYGRGRTVPLLEYSACTPLSQHGIRGGGQGIGWPSCAIELVNPAVYYVYVALAMLIVAVSICLTRAANSGSSSSGSGSGGSGDRGSRSSILSRTRSIFARSDSAWAPHPQAEGAVVKGSSSGSSGCGGVATAVEASSVHRPGAAVAAPSPSGTRLSAPPAQPQPRARAAGSATTTGAAASAADSAGRGIELRQRPVSAPPAAAAATPQSPTAAAAAVL